MPTKVADRQGSLTTLRIIQRKKYQHCIINYYYFLNKYTQTIKLILSLSSLYFTKKRITVWQDHLRVIAHAGNTTRFEKVP